MGMLENIKEAVKIVQQIDNIELYKKLLDLQAEALELSERLKDKDKKIEELEKALRIKGDLRPKDSAYYKYKNGNIEDGPFCQRCYNLDAKICRLVAKKDEPMVLCPNCNVEFASQPVFDFLRPDVVSNRLKILRSIEEQQRRHGQDYVL